MSCTDNCFLNCEKVISDQCVMYTGPDVPLLGICNGDQLSTVENDIVNALLTALDGTGILPSTVTLQNCPFLANQFVGETANLNNLLQLLIDSSCTLKSMIDTINAQLATNNMNFNTLCLQGLPATPTTNQIIQAVINTLCSINTTVNAIPTTYVKLSDLNNLVQQQIQQYLTNTQTNQINYYQYFPLLVALPYFGSLANFDNTGKGLASAGMTNMYLCNGLNGTPDLRGRGVIGAVRNVPGGALDSAVDPSNPANAYANVNYDLNDTAGENFHLLTIPETPSHSHGVNDSGHAHIQTEYQAINSGGNVPVGFSGVGPEVSGSYSTKTSTTGITLSSTGGSNAHNNIQPSKAAYWIIRMV
jgi:microcystin-dependent protein